jgi:hypothetical protein
MGPTRPSQVRDRPVRARWTLPTVTPEAARRRRIFFGAILLGLASTVALVAAVLLDAPGPTQRRIAAQLPTQPVGCTLAAGAEQLRLSIPLAMTLTDVAGRDQDAAATVTHTAAAVATLWPAESANADAVALSLRGYIPTALACTGTVPPATRQLMQTDGLTPRANAMWDAVKQVFGPLPAGGFMPGGVSTGHVPGSAHYEGRAIDFLYRPITAKSVRHGWVLAQWLEAHASQLQIATVIFDDRIWTPSSWDSRGWRPYVDPEGPTSNRTLLHEDHVHVDVQRGT